MASPRRRAAGRVATPTTSLTSPRGLWLADGHHSLHVVLDDGQHRGPGPQLGAQVLGLLRRLGGQRRVPFGRSGRPDLRPGRREAQAGDRLGDRHERVVGPDETDVGAGWRRDEERWSHEHEQRMLVDDEAAGAHGVSDPR